MSEKKTNKNKLTARQKRFVDAYEGNATAAARAAGFKNPNVYADDLMKNPRVIAAIQEREKERRSKIIATRDERLKHLTEIMRDLTQKTTDRLRAIEIMCRAEGDFIERQEITGKDGVPLLPNGKIDSSKLEIVVTVVDPKEGTEEVVEL